ncbi:MAG: SDR family oxidoreductase [Chloroflexota bacterium]|nr:MAG: SDR family oxidoreductase [Chloroflexota bacterium]
MNDYRTNETRVALISGASKGLGLELAGFLAARGYHLLLTARGRRQLEEAADQLRITGSKVTTIPGDIADPTRRQELLDAVQAFGRLHILVNNASTLGPLPMPALPAYRLDDLRRVFEVNTFAPLALVQGLRPLLAAAHGLVVNLSSDAAVGGYDGWGGYGSSKAALDLLSLTLANELRNDGIAVVSVDPGDMRTGMHQDAFPGEDIGDRPLPEVTLPFWAWLFGQDPTAINGQRFQAQSELWLVPA